MEQKTRNMMSANEYWNKRFGEKAKSDSEKLAVAMMQDYANWVLRTAMSGRADDPASEEAELERLRSTHPSKW